MVLLRPAPAATGVALRPFSVSAGSRCTSTQLSVFAEDASEPGALASQFFSATGLAASETRVCGGGLV